MCHRQTAEVLEIVREGMNNIRKQKLARRGAIKVECGDGLIRVLIENDADLTQPVDFRPRSISERTAALGGSAHVQLGAGGATAVHIEIPV